MSIELISTHILNKKINKTINIESYEILLEDDKFYVNIHIKNISKSIINGFDLYFKYSNEEIIINKDNLNIYPNKVIIEKIELKEFIDTIDNIDISNINLEEIHRKETIENKKLNKDKIIKYSKIGGPIFLGVLTIILLTIFLFVPLGKYNNAMELIDNKQYDEAKEILKDLDSFKDAHNQIELVKARECFDNLDYETGIQYVMNVDGQVEVNYDTDGGETLVTNEIIKKSKYINNDSNKTGYTFYGWSLKSYELDNKEYYAVINLKADYKPTEYNLTFNLDGGTFESDVPSTYTVLDEVKIPNPSKVGYEFIGWTGLGLEEPTLDLVIPKGSVGNKEYTANYKIMYYAITYYLNEGTMLTYENPKTYTVEDEITLINPIKEGYKFVGWTGTGLNEPTLTVTIAKGSTGDREYIAIWEVEEYTITYSLNGGTLSKSNPTGYDINTTTFTLNNPTKKGYEFIGWTGTGLSEPTLTVTITKGSIGDREYTANWSSIQYIITYNLGGNDVINENPTTYTEFTETFILNNPIRDGYKFIGWTSDGINNPIMVVEIPKGSTGNKEYTANWESDGLLYELNDDGASYTVYRGEYNKSEVIIPEYYLGLPVTSIGSDAFYNCDSLTSVVIPEGVTSIGSDAFYNCGKLTSISLPSTLTNIGSYAFYNCDSLTSVVIPEGVTSIGSYAFSCGKLTSIIVNENNQKYKSVDGNLYNKEGTELIQYANGKIEENFVVPEGVTSIGYDAFSCGKLTSISLPSTLTSIDSFAFSTCSSLTSIVIPEGVTSIGSYVFSFCSKLIIYCEISSQPSGWNSIWNNNNRPVYWASEWEYVDGVPTPIE